MRVELQVALNDPLRDAFLVELGQTLDGLHVHATDVNEFFADLLELPVLGLNERNHGGAALLHEGLIIEGNLANLVEGLAIAEDDVELASLVLRGDGGRRDRGDELIPSGGFGCLAPAFQGFGDTGDDVGLAFGDLRGIRE